MHSRVLVEKIAIQVPVGKARLGKAPDTPKVQSRCTVCGKTIVVWTATLENAE
jgi:hypothetical protein